MNEAPVQAASVALTLSQLLILRRVYQGSKKHPQAFILDFIAVDWEVLAAYQLIQRSIAETPTGKTSYEYRLAPNGLAFMKALVESSYEL